MKLYIFKCRARPRMYGATRYETASNLPTHECSGGWEFFERIDLTPQGRLRYAVNTAAVRRYIEQRGWHVWDESPLDSRNKETESPRVPFPQQQQQRQQQRQQPPAEAAVSAGSPGDSRKQGAESAPLPAKQHQPFVEPKAASEELTALRRKEAPAASALPDPQQKQPARFETIASADLEAFRRGEAAKNTPLPRPQQPAPVEPKTIGLEEWATSSRKKEVPGPHLSRQQHQPRVEPAPPASEKPPEQRRKEAAESTPLPRPEQRQPAAPRTDIPGVASAPAKKTVPGTADLSPSRPVQTLKPDKVETPTSLPKPAPRHQVVWFDIPVRDIDRAVRFYSAVLGTPLKKEQAGPGAAMVVLPHTEGSVGGCLVQNLDARPSEGGPLIYLNTQGRLDEALHAVEKHGGKLLAGKHSIAPFGFRAIVLDSEGNRIALHST